jgi:hypothetical protein
MSQLEPSTIGWLDSLGKVTPCHPDYADTDTTGAAPTSGNTTAGAHNPAVYLMPQIMNPGMGAGSNG